MKLVVQFLLFFLGSGTIKCKLIRSNKNVQTSSPYNLAYIIPVNKYHEPISMPLLSYVYGLATQQPLKPWFYNRERKDFKRRDRSQPLTSTLNLKPSYGRQLSELKPPTRVPNARNFGIQRSDNDSNSQQNEPKVDFSKVIMNDIESQDVSKPPEVLNDKVLQVLVNELPEKLFEDSIKIQTLSDELPSTEQSDESFESAADEELKEMQSDEGVTQKPGGSNGLKRRSEEANDEVSEVSEEIEEKIFDGTPEDGAEDLKEPEVIEEANVKVEVSSEETVEENSVEPTVETITLEATEDAAEQETTVAFAVEESVASMEDSEDPVTQEPVTEEHATEEPTTVEPSTEEPSTEEPVTEETVTEEPSPEEPSTEKVSKKEPSTEEPAAEKVSTEELSTKETVTEELGTEEPASEEPAIEDPATEEPALENPATEEPPTLEATEAETMEPEVTEEIKSDKVVTESTVEEITSQDSPESSEELLAVEDDSVVPETSSVEETSSEETTTEETTPVPEPTSTVKIQTARCGDMICPKETAFCRVKVKSLPPDFHQMLKTTNCLSTNEDVLKTNDALVDNPNAGKFYKNDETKTVERGDKNKINFGDFFVP